MSGSRIAIEAVIAERLRQVSEEGFTSAQDDEHRSNELSLAAAWYALPDIWKMGLQAQSILIWPWGQRWFKPKGRRRDLVRAAALLIAEIERLDRLAEAGDKG